MVARLCSKICPSDQLIHRHAEKIGDSPKSLHVRFYFSALPIGYFTLCCLQSVGKHLLCQTGSFAQRTEVGCKSDFHKKIIDINNLKQLT